MHLTPTCPRKAMNNKEHKQHMFHGGESWMEVRWKENTVNDLRVLLAPETSLPLCYLKISEENFPMFAPKGRAEIAPGSTSNLTNPNNRGQCPNHVKSPSLKSLESTAHDWWCKSTTLWMSRMRIQFGGVVCLALRLKGASQPGSLGLPARRIAIQKSIHSARFLLLQAA